MERLPQRSRPTRQLHDGPADVVHRRDIDHGIELGQRIDVRYDAELDTTLHNVPDQVFGVANARLAVPPDEARAVDADRHTALARYGDHLFGDPLGRSV